MTKSVIVTPKIKAMVEARIKDGIEKAENKYNIVIDMPTIKYDLRGKTAGKAYPTRRILQFNSVLLVENLEKYLKSTVTHELAHLVDYQMNPENFESGGLENMFAGTSFRGFQVKRKKRDVHGATWKAIMRTMGSVPNRCHNYDVTNATVKKKNRMKYDWVCDDCGATMKIGTVRHKKMMTKKATYWVRGCSSTHTYKFVGVDVPQKKLLMVAEAAKGKPAKPATKKAPKRGGSKLTACRMAYATALAATRTRARMIQRFQDLGCTPAGAATYYAKIKKEMS